MSEQGERHVVNLVSAATSDGRGPEGHPLARALGEQASATQTSPAGARDPRASKPDKLGIAAGKIKHVWLIILENKSYDASFTGLNNNTYLWQSLPAAMEPGRRPPDGSLDFAVEID